MLARLRAVTVPGVLALAAVGCTATQTQLLVVVTTDTPVDNPAELHVRCGYDWDGISPRSALECDRPLVHRQSDGGASMSLPGTFRVLGDPTREGQPLTFVIDDQTDPDVPPRLIRVVRVTLPAHSSKRVTVTIRAACEATLPACFPCGTLAAPGACTLSQYCLAMNMTCGDQGTCVSPDIPGADLPDDSDAGFDGSVAPVQGLDASCDAGATDSGTDASRDAARDASRDARD